MNKSMQRRHTYTHTHTRTRTHIHTQPQIEVYLPLNSIGGPKPGQTCYSRTTD